MKSPDKRIFNDVPTFKELITSIMETLVALGGSATVDELNEKVITSLNLSEEIEAKSYEPDGSGKPKIKTNLSWAHSYLKKSGPIDNSHRGIWSMSLPYNADSGIVADASQHSDLIISGLQNPFQVFRVITRTVPAVFGS